MHLKNFKAYECCLGPLRVFIGQGFQMIFCGTPRFQREPSGGSGDKETEEGALRLLFCLNQSYVLEF